MNFLNEKGVHFKDLTPLFFMLQEAGDMLKF